jgi:histidyl-tRNA synthetase
MFEDLGVFNRGIGEESEVVTKEMYEFEDKGGRHLALRPEGTASVVRAFVQHRPQTPWKAWYVTPAFRYERPQAGRYRQHHQLGVEALGSDDPDLDVEVIGLLAGYLANVGLTKLSLRINSMGDESCRPVYRSALSTFLSTRENELCDEHRFNWSKNPLRVLDCKREACIRLRETAPRFSQFLCDDCATHFTRVLVGLDAIGTPYVRDDFLVRGFDYYTRTTFEIVSEALEGAQNAVGGGGRYNGLTQLLGGPATPGIGFGTGIERVLLAAEAEGLFAEDQPLIDVFVIDLTGGDSARDLSFGLRGVGIATDRAFDARSMKAQLRAADRSGARIALIVGNDEREQNIVTIRVLRGENAHHQEQVERTRVADRVKELLS